MQYPESAPRSAEILRMVLPNLSRHCGSYAPTAYAVWYEHLAGTNAGLTDDLNQRLKQSEPLDPEVISELYTEHILSRDVQSTKLLQKSLEALVQQFQQTAANSSGSAEQYARTLESSHSELQDLNDSAELQTILKKLINSTRDARDSVGTLRTELNSLQTELHTVRERLGQLETEVVKDPLTGLLNRRGLDQALAHMNADGLALASASLLILDLDNFKRVNDSYGHLFGDQVLCATAKVLNSAIKGRDIAARIGGEEFLVVLPETPQSGAMVLAEQIRLTLSSAKVRRSGSDKVVDKLTISIGVVMPRQDESIEAAIERADAALYCAKREGRNCVRVAAPG